MFSKVLVANRGAVAARVLRTLDKLGIHSVAVYSEADRGAPYLALANETIAIGPSPPAESYLNQDRVLAALRQCGADAVHPGYGFLSENPTFAERVRAGSATFIGPDAKWLTEMGEKTAARQLMAQSGLPIGAGTGILPDDVDKAVEITRGLAYPLIVKPAEGGGGIGMLVAEDERALREAIGRARSMAKRSFGSTKIYVETLLLRPRHVEFQILADNYGEATHLFERDCSIQRRHQKVIEEAPAPNIDLARVVDFAQRTASVLADLGYNNIGTVETLLSADGQFSFLEMNTRLQVEHAVTEEITGIDIVASQIRLASGDHLSEVLPAPVRHRGHAVEARVYAEDPRTFYPSPGHLVRFRPPTGHGIRVETGYAEGDDVTPFYDPLLAKVITSHATREGAIHRLREAIAAFEIEGVKSNRAFIEHVLSSAEFRSGEIHTGLVASIANSQTHSGTTHGKG